MSRKTVTLAAISAMVCLSSGAAVFAQQATTAAPSLPATTPLSLPAVASGDAAAVIFSWAFKPGGFPANWLEGMIYFALGMAGALVTVYLFLGDFLPSMGGKAEYESLKVELDDFKSRRNHTLTQREEYARSETERPAQDRLDLHDKLTDDYDRIIERLEKRLSEERWRLLLLGFPIYILLGGFFAAAFANNLLQAILVGFGWTAIADRIGLERELNVKGEMRNKQIEIIVDEAAEQARKANRAVLEAQKRQLKIEEQKKLIDLLAREVGRS